MCLLLILLVGLAIRLSAAPFGGFVFDQTGFSRFASRLAQKPLSTFYTGRLLDHLPGDLWLLWLIAKAYQWFSPHATMRSAEFLYLLKLVPALADVGNGLMLSLIGRRLVDARAGLVAAGLYLFNPASIFLTSTWGQWDPVSVFFMLTALWLLLSGRVELSFPVLTYALLIKPQLAPLGLLFALAFAAWYIVPHSRRNDDSHRAVEPVRRMIRRCILGIMGSVLVLVAVPLPFSVAMPPILAHWSLIARVQFAWDLYPYATIFAFNVWSIPLHGAPYLQPDNARLLVGLTYQQWGMLLEGAAFGGILVLYWRHPSSMLLLWACLAMTLSSFMLGTRIHERYLFPAIPFAALLASIVPRLARLYVLLSASYLANLLFVYVYVSDPGRLHVPLPLVGPHPRVLHIGLEVFTFSVSVLNLVLLLYMFLRAHPIVLDAERHRHEQEPANCATIVVPAFRRPPKQRALE